MYSLEDNNSFSKENMNKNSVSYQSNQKQENQISKTWNDSHDLTNTSQAILKNASFSLSQTQKYRQQRTSLLQTNKTLASTTSNSSFRYKMVNINKRKNITGEQINESKNSLPCPYCMNHRSQACQLCKGSSKITNDCALINFFSYIVQYKLGVAQSFIPQQQKQKQKPSQKPKRKIQKSSILQRRKQFQNIHYGYYCDLCNDFSAIQGARFTCTKCQNFDLCQKCYKFQGHHHMMKQIEISPSYKSNLDCLERMSMKNRKFNNTELRKTHEKISKIQQKFFNSSIK